MRGSACWCQLPRYRLRGDLSARTATKRHMSSKKTSTKPLLRRTLSRVVGDQFGGSCSKVARRIFILGNLPLTIHGDYKLVGAKRSRFVPAQDGLAIIAVPEFSRYKDGTRSTCALAFLKGSYGTCRSDRCPLSSFIYNSLTPFHGGNTGSNPVGDAKSLIQLRSCFRRSSAYTQGAWTQSPPAT